MEPPTEQNISLPTPPNVNKTDYLTFLYKQFLECNVSQSMLRGRGVALSDNATDVSDNFTLVSRTHCPRTFDGYTCWNETPADTVVVAKCPDFVTGFSRHRYAHKTCLEDGSWFKHPETKAEWSNYTNCIDVEDFEFRKFINNLYVGGYSISLITLVISLCIFFSFRSLKCTRIKIHIHLFHSLALTCIAWICWYKMIIGDPSTLAESPKWCVVYHLVQHYLMLTNYFWMFCEALHLHLVLVVVFVKDAVALRQFLFIGWIQPIIWLAIYAFVRRSNETDEYELCWMQENTAMWILTAPVIFSLGMSMMILINVVRVLLTKLHPWSAQPAPLALKKATRATLILVPLFGLQHVLLPFRPERGSLFHEYYQVVQAILVSLQGLCVSCLFCFANHDVVYAVRSFLCRHFPNWVPPTFAGMGESNNAPAATQSRDVIV